MQEAFTQRYPNVKIVHGTFDDFDVIASIAELVICASANLVMNLDLPVRKRFLTNNKNPNCNIADAGDIDHERSREAICPGLRKRSEPSYLIHLSGTAAIFDLYYQTWEGKPSERIYSNIDDVNDICSLPRDRLHIPTDIMVQVQLVI